MLSNPDSELTLGLLPCTGAGQAATSAASSGPPRSTIIMAAVIPTAVVLAIVLGLAAFLLYRRSARAAEHEDSIVLPSAGSHSNKVRLHACSVPRLAHVK